MTGVQTCALDRKSTRLNSSHTIISYAVFCLKKKHRYSPHHTYLPQFSPPHPPRRRAEAAWAHGRRRALPLATAGVPHRVQQRLFFFNDRAATEISPLSLHDALPI